MSNTETFQWTNELVADYSRRSHLLSIWEFIAIWEAKISESKQPKKDWEIITYGWTQNHVNDKEKQCIHSVKRLSDGEVFTVNEIVNFEGNNYKIHSFEALKGGLYLDVISQNHLRLDICSVGKVKQPLFTTVDGKPVYEGDQIWYVSDDYYLGSLSQAKPEHSKGPKKFSSKDAAKEYLLMNKPTLSIQDVHNLCVFFGANSGLVDKAIQIVKSRS